MNLFNNKDVERLSGRLISVIVLMVATLLSGCATSPDAISTSECQLESSSGFMAYHGKVTERIFKETVSYTISDFYVMFTEHSQKRY